MTYNKHLEQYKSVDLYSRVETASPHELITLLIQGAQANITKVIGLIQQNNMSKKAEFVNKTVDIINNLLSSLDHEKGGEVAQNLEDFYRTVLKLLVDANLKNDTALFSKIHELLGEILSAWKAIKPSEGTAR